MFSPVGNQPPSVYWRRRLFVLGSSVVLILLIVLTIRVVAGGSDDGGSALADGTASSSGSTAAAGSSSDPASRTASTAGSSSSPASSTTAPAASSSAPVSSAVPKPCASSALAVQAEVGKSAYKVGQQPVVSLQVTNAGTTPCVQDLADKQIVLKVYNGESRVWGSHDCEIQPGTDERTLPAKQSVRVSITWSGRTSQEGCKGQRQRVGAGTYTLYAQLSGKAGKATHFTIS